MAAEDSSSLDESRAASWRDLSSKRSSIRERLEDCKTVAAMVVPAAASIALTGLLLPGSAAVDPEPQAEGFLAAVSDSTLKKSDIRKGNLFILKRKLSKRKFNGKLDII